MGGLNKPENRLFGNAHGFEFALLCVMTGIFAPIMEELFFRGALLKGLRGLFSRLQANVAIVSAVVLDAVLFAGAHGELVEFPGLALVGIVLAVIYVRTRRIVPCILTHAAFNGVAIVAVSYTHLEGVSSSWLLMRSFRCARSESVASRAFCTAARVASGNFSW